MRILYVEDNPANLFLVQRVARMGNHEVVTYSEGQPALDHYKDDKPDLVLMDIQLSGKLNGLEVVKALRAAGHKTPIIAVTAYAMSGDREKCLEAGCDGYLSKPLPVGELVELFKRYAPATKPAEVTAKPAVAAPVASTTVAPETKVETVPEVKPAPAMPQPPASEPVKVEAAPVAPTAATVPAPEIKPEVPASPITSPVSPATDNGVAKESTPTAQPTVHAESAKTEAEKSAAPLITTTVENAAPAPSSEPGKVADSANGSDASTAQGVSKETGEKISLESKQS